MKTLYEINEQIQLLLEAEEYAEDTEGLYEAIESLQLEKAEKIESVALYAKELTARVDQWKAEEKRLKSERETMEKKIISIKCWLGHVMGKGKLQTEKVNISAHLDRSVLYTGTVPDEYKHTVERKEVDKKRVSEELNSGKCLPFAKIVEKKRVK